MGILEILLHYKYGATHIPWTTYLVKCLSHSKHSTTILPHENDSINKKRYCGWNSNAGGHCLRWFACLSSHSIISPECTEGEAPRKTAKIRETTQVPAKCYVDIPCFLSAEGPLNLIAIECARFVVASINRTPCFFFYGRIQRRYYPCVGNENIGWPHSTNLIC